MRSPHAVRLSPKLVYKALPGLVIAFVVGMLVFLMLPAGRPLLMAVLYQPIRYQDLVWGCVFGAAVFGGWRLWTRLGDHLR